MALVGEPDLLLLDEPINGLDPQGIAEIRDMIFKLRDEQNMTIIISSHIFRRVVKIATHYGIIHNGTLSTGNYERRVDAALWRKDGDFSR